MASAYNPYAYLAGMETVDLWLSAIGDFVLLFVLAVTLSLGAVYLLRRWWP